MGAKTFGQIHGPLEPADNMKKAHQLTVLKSDDDKRQIFGWASVAVRASGEVLEDLEGDIIEIDELENAVYEYVLNFRTAGEMHERGGVGTLIESVVFTKEKMRAMGIPEGLVGEAWWVGYQITDDEVWKKIKAGTYRSLSIEGHAQRVPV